MRLFLRCPYYLFLILVLKSNAAVIQNNVGGSRVRERRQDGYVYDKPSVSFDLPSRPTTEFTQAPNVDRILAQPMSYAYSAPAGGDTINVGRKAVTTVSTTTASAVPEGVSSGYNYQSSNDGSVGYKYGTPFLGLTETQANIASQVTNTVTLTTVPSTASGTNANSKTDSGYNYKEPSPTSSPSFQDSSEVSTSAPRYLPPAGSSVTGNFGGESNVNIGSGSIFSGSGQVTGARTETQSGTTSVGTLSESYLPPLINNAVSTSKTPISISISNQVEKSGGSVFVPSTAYLPPKSSSSSPLMPQKTLNTSQSGAPANEYIPPTNPGSESGTVATPAASYLPPGFF